MALRRRGLAHRCVALLLAVAMPMCCCLVNSLTGAGCCADPAPVVESASCCSTTSCCATRTTDDDTAPVSSDSGSCVCCLKAPGPVFDWTVPVDLYGTQLPDLSTGTLLLEMPATSITADARNDDHPPPWHSAAALRGCVILNC